MQINKYLPFNFTVFCNYLKYKLCCAAVVSTFSLKHFTHLISQIGKKKRGTKMCHITKRASYLLHPAATVSPCSILNIKSQSLFMCAVQHHHESCLGSNKHYMQKGRVLEYRNSNGHSSKVEG